MATKKRAAKKVTKQETPASEPEETQTPETTPEEETTPSEAPGRLAGAPEEAPHYTVPEGDPGENIARVELVLDTSRGRFTALFTYRDGRQEVPGSFVCDNYGFTCLEVARIMRAEAKRTGVIT